MALDKDLLEILACPKCRESVHPSQDGKWLICEKCRLKYKVENDIPIMLVDQAQPLEG